MTGFADYRARAVTLPAALAMSHSASSSTPSSGVSLYGLFASVLPADTEISMHNYVRMIVLTATILGDDSTREDAEKIQILKGLYCYVFYMHDTPTGWITSKPLLCLLKEHLGLESPSQLPSEERQRMFHALGAWCEALFQYPSPTTDMTVLRTHLTPGIRQTVYTLEQMATVGSYAPGFPGPSECFVRAQDMLDRGMRSLFS